MASPDISIEKVSVADDRFRTLDDWSALSFLVITVNGQAKLVLLSPVYLLQASPFTIDLSPTPWHEKHHQEQQRKFTAQEKSPGSLSLCVTCGGSSCRSLLEKRVIKDPPVEKQQPGTPLGASWKTSRKRQREKELY